MNTDRVRIPTGPLTFAFLSELIFERSCEHTVLHAPAFYHDRSQKNEFRIPAVEFNVLIEGTFEFLIYVSRNSALESAIVGPKNSAFASTKHPVSEKQQFGFCFN